ncbi:MAG: class I SAM-dependent methyltransferase [Burkholderiales bacterium]
MSELFTGVARHYGEAGIGERILAALAGEGVDIENLTTASLATIDQFHTRGLSATREQAEAVAPSPTMHVLDVGCGVGGPARFLAETYGCRVTGIDLTTEYVDVAQMLSSRCRLDHLTSFRQANALDLPFMEATFDLAWCQNVSMNIPDKYALYAEIHRVLKPGGKFAAVEIIAGERGDPVFPLPWAREPSISFVASAHAMQSALERAGFRIVTWRDTTSDAVAISRNPAEQTRRGKLGVGLVAGTDFSARSANLARCLAEGRFLSVLLVAERPSQ